MRIRPYGLRDIAMNIAVASMTEGNEPGTGDGRCHRALGLGKEDGSTAEHLGARKTLEKPFPLEKLLAIVRGMMAERR